MSVFYDWNTFTPSVALLECNEVNMFMFERVGNEPWQPCTYPHDKRTGFEPSFRAVALVNLTRSYKTRQPLHHLNVVLICLCFFWLSSMLWSFLINTRQTSVIIYSVSLERSGEQSGEGRGAVGRRSVKYVVGIDRCMLWKLKEKKSTRVAVLAKSHPRHASKQWERERVDVLANLWKIPAPGEPNT